MQQRGLLGLPGLLATRLEAADIDALMGLAGSVRGQCGVTMCWVAGHVTQVHAPCAPSLAYSLHEQPACHIVQIDTGIVAVSTE